MGDSFTYIGADIGKQNRRYQEKPFLTTSVSLVLAKLYSNGLLALWATNCHSTTTAYTDHLPQV